MKNPQTTKYKIELSGKELKLIADILNKEINNSKDIYDERTTDLLLVTSRLSSSYLQPSIDEIGEFISKKFNL